jgi:hypothetical protein
MPELAVINVDPIFPSVYVAVALNCWVKPTARFALDGVTAMETTVGGKSEPPPQAVTQSNGTSAKSVARRMLTPVPLAVCYRKAVVKLHYTELRLAAIEVHGAQSP